MQNPQCLLCLVQSTLWRGLAQCFDFHSWKNSVKNNAHLFLRNSMAMFPSASSLTTFPFLENLSNSLPSTTMVVKANIKMNDIMAEENMVIFHLPLPQPHSN